MTRSDCIEQARQIITKDRNATHGEPENSFATIAAFWSTYLDIEIAPFDVAAMMALLKLARIKENPDHLDSWIDTVGYCAIGPELLKL